LSNLQNLARVKIPMHSTGTDLMTNSITNGNSKVIDSPSSVEIYANIIVGTSFDGSAIIVSLGTTRFIPDQLGQPITTPPDVYVTGRIALSLKAALELSKAIQELVQAASNKNASSMIKPMATVSLNSRPGEAAREHVPDQVIRKILS
jgi:hypothetical protein